jgi:hypothetical protein
VAFLILGDFVETHFFDKFLSAEWLIWEDFVRGCSHSVLSSFLTLLARSFSSLFQTDLERVDEALSMFLVDLVVLQARARLIVYSVLKHALALLGVQVVLLKQSLGRRRCGVL